MTGRPHGRWGTRPAPPLSLRLPRTPPGGSLPLSAAARRLTSAAVTAGSPSRWVEERGPCGSRTGSALIPPAPQVSRLPRSRWVLTCDHAGPGRPALSPDDCPRPHAATSPGAVWETRADSPGCRHRSSCQARRRFDQEGLLSAITTLPYVTRQVHQAGRQDFTAVSESPCSRRCRYGTPPPGAVAGPWRAGWRRPRSARSAPGRRGRAPPPPRAGGVPTPGAGR